MDTNADAGRKKDEPATVSLVELSKLAIIQNPDLIFAGLARRGCVLTPPSASWRPLSGGLEYNHYIVNPISVDEVLSSLIVEITRTVDRPDQSWVNGFELRPADRLQSDWSEKIRALLRRDFELAPATGSAAEMFFRDGSECLFIPASATDLARLLLHRRLEINEAD